MFTPHEVITPQNGGNASSFANVFSSLAVPAGLFYAQQNIPLKETRPIASSINVISTTLHDNLLKLAQDVPEIKKQPRYSKKQTGVKTKDRKKNKTRKI